MLNSSRPETVAVHAGRRVDPTTGAVTPNLTFATTFERAADGTLPHGHIYSRYDTPNRHAIEEAVAALEGGAEALAFSSGQAATAAVLATLAPGARIILPEDIYHGSRALAEGFYARWGARIEVVDLADTAAALAALRTPAQLLWIETPSNPRMRITDVATLAAAGRAAGALVMVDNTFASPILQNPLSLGAHVVMHSSTKYLGGHSDVLGGLLVAGTDCPAPVRERLREWQKLGGAVPAPFDCWLLLRSLATLPIRVRAQSESAAKVAAWLAAHPRVEVVHYPGLPTHPGHALAKKQMRGFGGMVSFEVRGGFDAAHDVVAKVKLFTRATSLGGVESLIEHRKRVESPTSTVPAGLIRVSCGLEHVDDLIADLAQALG